jgi:molybdenum cofactor biosynthesis enzyme MoaA
MHITSYILDDAIDARKNRLRYYQAGLDYRIKNSIPCKINGKKWNLYWNINIYVDLSSKCNANCAFCINRVNFKRKDIADDFYVTNFYQSVKEVRFLDPSIQIVGGEPTLHPDRLCALTGRMSKLNLRKPVLGTNGSGLCNNNLIQRIAPVFQHINISRHHYDDEMRNQVMGFKNPLDNDKLLLLVKNKDFGHKIRLNCCLLSGYIDNFGKVVNYLNWAVEMGFRNVCFSTLSVLPGDYIYDPGLVNYAKLQAVDLNSLMNEVTSDLRFSFVKFHSGSHCMYEVWNYTSEQGGCVVVFSTSNNHYAQLLDQTEGLIEQMVFHTDGVLTGSWDRNCKEI